jgi:coatomer protein complex subunit gamma
MLTSKETTDVFFGVTKLFQSNNSNLRRMMYLFIKEVAETCNPDDVIIVTSSLTKV